MEDQNREFQLMSSSVTAPTTAASTRSGNDPPYYVKEPSIKDARQSMNINKVNKKVEYYQFNVGTSGGILAIPGEGISLVIPPDAVPLDDQSDLTITIGIHRELTSDFEAETGYIALSPTVTLEPHGLVFHMPVYLFLPSYAVPNLSKLPDTILVCSETSAVSWQPADEGGDKSVVAYYPKHVVVKMKHFGHLKYVIEYEQNRPLDYVNVLVFASYQRDSEKVALGVFIVNSEQQEEAKRRGREEYDQLLTEEDFAVFKDDQAVQCVNVGICDLPVKMDPPFPERQQEIPTLDILNSAVRQARVTIPMRDRQGDLRQSLECNLSIRQRGGLNRRISITRNISRQDTTHKDVVDLLIPLKSGGRNQPILRVTQSYKEIPQTLKDSLKTLLTSQPKKVLAEALYAHQDTDVGDLLFLWEIVQGSTNLLTDMANLFRNANCKNIATVIERYF